MERRIPGKDKAIRGAAGVMLIGGAAFGLGELIPGSPTDARQDLELAELRGQITDLQGLLAVNVYGDCVNENIMRNRIDFELIETIEDCLEERFMWLENDVLGEQNAPVEPTDGQ